ncbi:hypothetical protein EW145_g2622 [Phellinidium pouzarii]|uniref:FAD-binding domain-containing protein n=1 Tax=Phellinidium pouzarii TaxID=167371 RepID=A0A4S4LAL5_9AGAM|nr:hypothetical protein EW145_g2622 [Phellinidium pouzarii]
MSTPKFSVAVCGGGIGGLTATIAITRLSRENKDIRIDLYEAAQGFTEIGAGIGMWRRPWNVMKSLDLGGVLGKLCEIPADEDKSYLSFQMRKSDQTKGIPYWDVIATMGNLTFHRADFIDTLSEQIDPETTTAHFSKRLISYTLPPKSSPPGPITLNFKDGTTSTCDVLVAADGIHSATRHTMLKLAAIDAEADGSEEGRKAAEMLREMVDPVWSGSVAYRAVVPREKLEKINPNHSAMFMAQNYTGNSKHVIVFPISHGRLVNIVAFCSWPDKVGTIFEGKTVEDRSKEELFELYAGWEEEVQQLLQCIEKPSRWAINALKGLPISTHDRVALLGDAAHAMTPHLGSGAGQAIEDAYILSALLAHPLTTLSTLPVALKVYEDVRLPHANDVQRRSAENGHLYEFNDSRFAGLDATLGDDDAQLNEVDAGKLRDLGHAATENWKWAWTTDIEDDRNMAIALLKERIEVKGSI